MLFYVSPGVGADQLVAKEGRLCIQKDSVKAPQTGPEVPPDSDNQNTMGYAANEAPEFPLLYAGKGRPFVSLDKFFGVRAKPAGGANGTVVATGPPKVVVPPVSATSSATRS
jgi:hypothetical protein